MWCRFDGNEWLCNIRCVYVELLRSWFVASWFEVLRDFNWLPGLYGLKFGNLIAWRSFLHLNSYNLVGSVTDTLTLSSFPSYYSSPTQLPRHSRIQQTHYQCFDHNFFIRHRNRVILDSLERGQWHHRFGSGPSSRSFVDSSLWPQQDVVSPILG